MLNTRTPKPQVSLLLQDTVIINSEHYPVIATLLSGNIQLWKGRLGSASSAAVKSIAVPGGHGLRVLVRRLTKKEEASDR